MSTVTKFSFELKESCRLHESTLFNDYLYYFCLSLVSILKSKQKGSPNWPTYLEYLLPETPRSLKSAKSGPGCLVSCSTMIQAAPFTLLVTSLEMLPDIFRAVHPKVNKLFFLFFILSLLSTVLRVFCLRR